MKKRHALGLLGAVSSLILMPLSAQAHHGSGGQFDLSTSVTNTGTVTKIKLVNPHSYIYFNVVDENGETNEWRCELRSASIHRRYGWTKEMFKEGTQVTITGPKARREDHGCMTRTITFADGTVLSREDKIDSGGEIIPKERSLKLPNGKPNISGLWVAPPREGGAPPGANGMGAPGGAMGAPPGGMGGPPGGGNTISLTAAGKAALVGVENDDNPRFHCKPVNLFQDWTFDQHVNMIEQYEDTIVLRYGFMDMTRTIHMNMKSQPKDITPSRAGHSIGKWVKGVLVVETTGFSEGFLSTGRAGMTKHSNQMSTTERFTMSKDGTTLTREYEASDPLYLKETRKGEDVVAYTASAFESYDCDDLTQEVAPGF